jgi:hypothetical protein
MDSSRHPRDPVQVETRPVEADSDQVGPSGADPRGQSGRMVAFHRVCGIDRVTTPGTGAHLDGHTRTGIVDEEIDLAAVHGDIGGDDAQPS